MKAWVNLDRLRNPEAFPGWLRRIAVRALLDTVRLKRDEIPFDQIPEFDGGIGEAEAVNSRIDVEAALLRLSVPARMCILLFYVEGMTHPEIADDTGIPIGTVKSHIARATARLRMLLAEWRA